MADEPATEILEATISCAHTRHVAINQSSNRLDITVPSYSERHLLADEQLEGEQ